MNGEGLSDVVAGWKHGDISRICLHPRTQNVREPYPGITAGRIPHVEDAGPIDLDNEGALAG